MIGFHRERRRRHLGQKLRDRVVAADRAGPTGPARSTTSRQISRQRLPRPRRRRRQRQPAGVERDERELQALALAPEEVLLRDADVREADDAVLDGLQAHEVAADDDLDAGPGPLDDERRDLLRVGVPRHDDEELGDRAVRAPELLAVEDVVAVRRPRRGRREVGRIRADLRLGQRERRDRAAREPREGTSSSAPASRRASAAAGRRSTGAPTAA